MPEGQNERGTTLACEHCGAEFRPTNRNGIPARFCSRACLDRKRNASRLQAAAASREKPPRRRGPSKRAQAVSQYVFMALVPIEERAELIRQAAQNLGITDEGEVLRALRRNGCPVPPPSAFSLQPSGHMEAQA